MVIRYEIVQINGLWTVLENGIEVEGIASFYKENAENYVKAMKIWRENPSHGKGVYVHFMSKKPKE